MLMEMMKWRTKTVDSGWAGGRGELLWSLSLVREVKLVCK